MRFSFLVASILLAGCVGDTESATGETNPTTIDSPLSLDISWGLKDCRAGIWTTEIDPAAITPHLPPGFTPQTTAQGMSGAPANPTGEASFGIELLVCAEGAGLNGTVTEMVYGSLFAFVEPPADLVVPGVNAHFVKWNTVIPDVDRRMALAAFDAPIFEGGGEWNTYTLTGSVGEVDGALAIGEGDFRITGSSGAPGPLSFSFAEYMPARDGFLVWKATTSSTAIGIGTATVTVGGEGLATEVLGAGTHEGTIIISDITFGDASIKYLRHP